MVRGIPLILILMPFCATTQETRSMIYGRVLDPSDAPVAGARVVVTHTDTNTAVTLKTNETGYYEANLLLPGTYTVSVEITGFKKAIQKGILLTVSTRQEIDIRLEIGAVTEAVAVTAQAPLLETNAVSSGRVIDNRSLAELPVLTSNPNLLAKFTPGVQFTGTNRYLAVSQTAGSSSFNTTGNVGSNDYAIDGAPNVGHARQISYVPPTDALLEFKVETSSFDASIGTTTGASVAMMTKAGSNELHGTASWLHWQQRWTGTPFFTRQLWYRKIAEAEAAGNAPLAQQLRNTPKQPSGHANNYSATIGGPVIIPKLINGRNKLFYFFSFYGSKDKKPGEGTPQATVPTMQQREGDLSDLLKIKLNPASYQIFDPLSVAPDPSRPTHFVRSPIPGNVIPKSRMINPAYSTYVKFYPQPNRAPADPGQAPLNNYLAVGQPLDWDYSSISGRLDYAHSDKHRFFARGSWYDYKEDMNDWTYESARGLQSNGLHRINPSGTVDWVFTPSPNTIWNVATSLNHFYQTVLVKLPLTYKPSDVGLPQYMDQKAGDLAILPEMNFSGYSGLSQPRPYVEIVQTLSGKADVTHIRGDHSLRAGFNMRQYYRNGHGNSNSSGYFSFDNNFTRQTDDNLVNPAGNLGHAWAAFLMGMPGSIRVDTIDSFAHHNPYSGWFAQDNWRVRKRLSLTLGLRMEYESGPTERYNRMIGWFDPNLSIPIAAGAAAAYAQSPVPQVPANQFKAQGGSVYPGVRGQDRRLWISQLMFLPRIAAAYQVRTKTVLRAGFGTYYDSYNVLQTSVTAYYYDGFSRSTTPTITSDFGQTWNVGDPKNGASALKDPFPVRADGSRFDQPPREGLGSMQMVGRSMRYWDPNDTKHARQFRGRLGLQHQLDAATVIEVAYIRTYSDNVYIAINLNPLPEQYWAAGLKRNDAIASDLSSNVTNPFYIGNFNDLKTSNPLVYQDMTTNGFYTSRTIRKNQLLRAFPQMTGLTQNDAPRGETKTDSIEVSVQRRFSKGFNLNFYYTGLRQRDRDYYANEFDPAPSWRISNNGRPHRVAASGIYELPFGKGRRLAKSGIQNVLLGGWQVGATYEYQPGALVAWGNIFYYGDPDNINAGARTLDQWFNTSGVYCGDSPGGNSGFERCSTRGPASYHRRVFPTRLDGLRAGSMNTWNTNAIRDFKIGERAHFLLRLDVLNLANRSEWSAPNTDPFSTNFGRVTAVTTSQKRFLQIQGKIRF